MKRALTLTGPRPWLVGYDINGIQELITASSRPILMRGASQIIGDFDAASSTELTIFAGGGRGVELAPSQEDASARIDKLVRGFREATRGGVLVATSVPYDPANAHASLLWLQRKLSIEKDAAPPTGGALPATKDAECADCSALEATVVDRRGTETAKVCERCAAMRAGARGAAPAEVQQSILAFASRRRIAAISADGNNLGNLFAELTSLEELAGASEAIAFIFREAHHAARTAIGHDKALCPVIGGDDLRLFLAPERVIPYVTHLARGVEKHAAGIGDLGGLLSPKTARALAALGVGVGAAIAGDHYPAARLMEHAHALEREAKALCRSSKAATGKTTSTGARSAFDFAVLTTGSPFAPGTTGRRPFSLDEPSWSEALKAAEALRDVPPAQRAIVAEMGAHPDVEAKNLFRYQVARSRAWQAYYDARNLPWHDAAKLDGNLPDLRLLEILAPDPDKEARR